MPISGNDARRVGAQDGTARRMRSLYDQAYAERYEALYLRPWLCKHELNVTNVVRVLRRVAAARPAWLDLCCGQAWHFSRFSTRVRKVGIDASPAQLALARRRNPDARFLEGDVLDVEPGDGCYDLVTCFWAAYCYLGQADLIRRLLATAIRRLRPGGALYFEVLLPGDVAMFNASEFARATGSRVVPADPDCSRWTFHDIGGVHVMLSPPLELFLRAIEPYFHRVEALHDSGFMTHVIAEGRRREMSAAVDDGCPT